MHFLLANNRVCSNLFNFLLFLMLSLSLFSSIQLIGTDYSTQNCECRIKDVACLGWCVVFSFHAQITCTVPKITEGFEIFSYAFLHFSTVEMSLAIMWRFRASLAFGRVTTGIFGCSIQLLFIPWKDWIKQVCNVVKYYELSSILHRW